MYEGGDKALLLGNLKALLEKETALIRKASVVSKGTLRWNRI
jgi:hypothetical protein